MESHKDRVYRDLKYKIIMRKLEPGSVINEKNLMEEHEIGRTPLREIFILLEREGLIRRFPRSGTIVSPMDLNQLKSTNEIRIPLERLVGALVVERITDNEVEALQELLERAKHLERTGSEQKLVDYDTQLHEFLYQITANRKLVEIMQELHAIGSRFWFSITYSPEEYQDQLDQWDRIVTAIARRDAERTQELLEEHVKKAIRSIKANL
ncbi:MAG: GntR family transcriptional regulator [Alkalispirochaeta sp.]|jgi:DNA-binding GntR family transcriptional regulator